MGHLPNRAQVVRRVRRKGQHDRQHLLAYKLLLILKRVVKRLVLASQVGAEFVPSSGVYRMHRPAFRPVQLRRFAPRVGVGYSQTPAQMFGVRGDG